MQLCAFPASSSTSHCERDKTRKRAGAARHTLFSSALPKSRSSPLHFSTGCGELPPSQARPADPENENRWTISFSPAGKQAPPGALIPSIRPSRPVPFWSPRFSTRTAPEQTLGWLAEGEQHEVLAKIAKNMATRVDVLKMCRGPQPLPKVQAAGPGALSLLPCIFPLGYGRLKTSIIEWKLLKGLRVL